MRSECLLLTWTQPFQDSSTSDSGELAKTFPGVGSNMINYPCLKLIDQSTKSNHLSVQYLVLSASLRESHWNKIHGFQEFRVGSLLQFTFSVQGNGFNPAFYYLPGYGRDLTDSFSDQRRKSSVYFFKVY